MKKKAGLTALLLTLILTQTRRTPADGRVVREREYDTY